MYTHTNINVVLLLIVTRMYYWTSTSFMKTRRSSRHVSYFDDQRNWHSRTEDNCYFSQSLLSWNRIIRRDDVKDKIEKTQFRYLVHSRDSDWRSKNLKLKRHSRSHHVSGHAIPEESFERQDPAKRRYNILFTERKKYGDLLLPFSLQSSFTTETQTHPASS